MPYFQKVTAEDGTDSFVEVDFAEMDIPKEVIVGSKEYKAVAESDFKRRKRIADLTASQLELQKKLQSAGAEVVETEEDAPETPAVEQPAASAPVDPEALYKDFKARLAAERKAEIEAEQERAKELEKAAKDAGLPKSAASILKYSNDPVAMAKELALQQYRFDDVGGGDVVPENEEVFLDKVFKNIGI